MIKPIKVISGVNHKFCFNPERNKIYLTRKVGRSDWEKHYNYENSRKISLKNAIKLKKWLELCIKEMEN
jgi:hypothetical protein